MKLAIMQPYFFPSSSYFELINYVDLWIVYDVSSYIRHGWINRNRILHASEKWQYINVPIKSHSHEDKINDILIAPEIKWKEKIFRQLDIYRKKAPHYNEVIDLLKICLSDDEKDIALLNTNLLRKVMAALNIKTELMVFSEMNLNIGKTNSTQELALNICKAVGAIEYANRPSGAVQFNEKDFAEEGIKLTIQNKKDMVYSCNGFNFEPMLSIIDVIMWNSPEEINKYFNSPFIAD